MDLRPGQAQPVLEPRVGRGEVRARLQVSRVHGPLERAAVQAERPQPGVQQIHPSFEVPFSEFDRVGHVQVAEVEVAFDSEPANARPRRLRGDRIPVFVAFDAAHQPAHKPGVEDPLLDLQDGEVRDYASRHGIPANLLSLRHISEYRHPDDNLHSLFLTSRRGLFA